AYTYGNTLVVELGHPMPLQIFNATGQRVYSQTGATRTEITNLPAGLYLVKAGSLAAKKVIVH
ncbi:MAG: T9SS type A sorting domain-containing protein, partial [Bacteroidales bacterium]|nr:T9SS type A sorting domain-containing protein [Bacteroidales bacterium]